MLTQVRGANGCTYCRSDLDSIKTTNCSTNQLPNCGSKSGSDSATYAGSDKVPY